MARIRTVKPELAKHELLYELEQETNLPIRFAWAMLPTQCDREGRFKWRPRSLKLEILPYDLIDFESVLDALLTRGFIVKYRVGDAWYGYLPTFLSHQVINHRESASQLPSFQQSEESIDHRKHASRSRGQRVAHSPTTEHGQASGEGKGKELEGKGKEGVAHTDASLSRPDVASPVPMHSDLMVERLLAEHPRVLSPVRAQQEAVAAIQRESVKFGGDLPAYEYLLERTKLYKQATDTWPQPDREYIVSAENFFKEKRYQVSEKLWTKGVTDEAVEEAINRWA